MIEERGKLFLSSNGDYWYFEGERHRDLGPAIITKTGTKLWYQFGRFHRLDGPACEYADGHRRWFIHGEEYTEIEHKFWSKFFS